MRSNRPGQPCLAFLKKNLQKSGPLSKGCRRGSYWLYVDPSRLDVKSSPPAQGFPGGTLPRTGGHLGTPEPYEPAPKSRVHSPTRIRSAALPKAMLPEPERAPGSGAHPCRMFAMPGKSVTNLAQGPVAAAELSEYFVSGNAPAAWFRLATGIMAAASRDMRALIGAWLYMRSSDGSARPRDVSRQELPRRLLRWTGRHYETEPPKPVDYGRAVPLAPRRSKRGNRRIENNVFSRLPSRRSARGSEHRPPFRLRRQSAARRSCSARH